MRALVNEPRLLLLDEVTSALDPELVGEVLDLVGDLRGQGVTMLIATHDDGLRPAGRRPGLLLDRGRILESGPPASCSTRRATRVPAVSAPDRRGILV